MRILIFLCLGLSSCTYPTASKSEDATYFDLKGFFEKESLRLNKMKQPIQKTVSRNGIQETKAVQTDWAKELSLFTESDINKSAWKNSYLKRTKKSGIIEYIALEDKLKTRRIEISKSGTRIKSIRILNRTSNFLYKSTETLAYFPDSIYVINKDQQVQLLGKNTYLITGRFK